ncbi:MAG: PqqD family protein [Pseudomonadota bacterium]
MIYQKVADSFVETELDGELVLLNLESGKFHALKDTGLAIWRLIDGVNDVEAIQRIIKSQYDVDDTTCRDKVTSFLGSLTAAGFVKT